QVNPPAVDLKRVDVRVSLVAQLGQPAVNAHAAHFDHLFGAAARGDAQLRHQFLNAFFHRCSAFQMAGRRGGRASHYYSKAFTRLRGSVRVGRGGIAPISIKLLISHRGFVGTRYISPTVSGGPTITPTNPCRLF